jgi:hypothetical protein
VWIICTKNRKLGESGSHVSLLTKIRAKSKKKTWYSSQAATQRVQKLRVEYWEKIKDIKPENLVFLDETGILLGLTRTHSRSPSGTRVVETKPFYRGALIHSYWRN